MLLTGLMARNVRGEPAHQHLGGAVLGMVFGVSPAPFRGSTALWFLHQTSPPFMRLDMHGRLPSTTSFRSSSPPSPSSRLFDNMGTLISPSPISQLMDDRDIKNLDKALCRLVGTVTNNFLGTSHRHQLHRKAPWAFRQGSPHRPDRVDRERIPVPPLLVVRARSSALCPPPRPRRRCSSWARL